MQGKKKPKQKEGTKMKGLNISFSDRMYQRSHFTAPKGRGNWMFQFGENENVKDWFSSYGTLTEAKKDAKEEAYKRFAYATGSLTIHILP
jgi:hypothetical protein